MIKLNKSLNDFLNFENNANILFKNYEVKGNIDAKSPFDWCNLMILCPF